MKERYAKLKLSNNMLGMGHGKHLAKLLGSIIYHMTPPSQDSQVAGEATTPTDKQLWKGSSVSDEALRTNPEEFNNATISIYNDEKSTFGTMVLEWFLGKQELGDKQKALDKAMEKHPDWSGCQTKAGLPATCTYKLKPIDDDASLMKSEGAQPWIFGQLRCAWRCGGHTFPMPGLPCVTRALGDALYRLLVPCAELLASGITINDTKAFLETSAGQELITKHAVVLNVKPGVMVYIPGGFLQIVVSMRVDDADASDMTFGWSMPLFVPKLFATMKRSTWAGIKDHNDQVFDKTEGGLWQSRKESFGKLCEEVEQIVT